MPSATTPESIRDAAALITTVVRVDGPGQRAILDNCDKDETLLCLAGMFAMLMQVSSGCTDDTLADVVQEFAEGIALGRWSR